MAARTRGQILDLVHEHTGRTKAVVEAAACNDALKMAQMKHAFRDAQTTASDYGITAAATYVTVNPSTTIVGIVSGRIIETSGSRNKILRFKTRNWWDEHVINPEDNMKGWPEYALHQKPYVFLDRPADSGLSLRLRLNLEAIFTSVGSTGISTCVCPIYVLDKFVEYYTTAQVFQSIRSWDSYAAWMRKALGPKWDTTGEPGGELLQAIQADSILDTALDIRADEPMPSVGGVAVENVIEGHDDLGNTRWWK